MPHRYAYTKVSQLNVWSPEESTAQAQALIDTYNCSLYTSDTLTSMDPRNYLSQLCVDG